MRTGLSIPAVKRAEGDDSLKASAEAQEKIRSILEAAGVEFTNGDAPGVRLGKGTKA